MSFNSQVSDCATGLEPLPIVFHCKQEIANKSSQKLIQAAEHTAVQASLWTNMQTNKSGPVVNCLWQQINRQIYEENLVLQQKRQWLQTQTGCGKKLVFPLFDLAVGVFFFFTTVAFPSLYILDEWVIKIQKKETYGKNSENSEWSLWIYYTIVYLCTQIKTWSFTCGIFTNM